MASSTGSARRKRNAKGHRYSNASVWPALLKDFGGTETKKRMGARNAKRSRAESSQSKSRGQGGTRSRRASTAKKRTQDMFKPRYRDRLKAKPMPKKRKSGPRTKMGKADQTNASARKKATKKWAAEDNDRERSKVRYGSDASPKRTAKKRSRRAQPR